MEVGGRVAATTLGTTEEVRALAKQRGDRFAELEDRFVGYTVYDVNYEKIGKVDDLFVDEDDNPEYVGVKTGFLGTNSTLIPVDLVRVNDRRGLVEIAADKDVVKDGPSFVDDEEITPEYEDRVREHYGLGKGRQGAAQRGTYADYYERDEVHPSRSAAVVGPAEHGHRSGHRERDRGRGEGLGAAARHTGVEDELRVQRVEEELRAGTREREVGATRVRKRVRTERERIRVPKRREEISVERVPVEVREAGEAEIGEEEFFVSVTEEEVVVEKRPVVKEEIRVRKDVVEDEELIEEDVRKEEIDIDDRTERGRSIGNGANGRGETVRRLPRQTRGEIGAEERSKTDGKTDRREGASEEGQRQRATNAKAAKETRGNLPLEGYNDLTVEEAKKKIGRLSEGELKKIRSFEKKHKNRKTLVEQLDRKIKDAS